MTRKRFPLAIAASALALATALALAPTRAHGDAGDRGIPCRISWDDTTHGGDWTSAHGEITLTQIMPSPGGAFVAMGQGTATVTYHSANNCRITTGNPFTGHYMATLHSEDGQTAEVDIQSVDTDSHHMDSYCFGNNYFGIDADSPDPMGVTAPLVEGSTPYSEDNVAMGRHAGRAGTVTLHYCRAP